MKKYFLIGILMLLAVFLTMYLIGNAFYSPLANNEFEMFLEEYTDPEQVCVQDFIGWSSDAYHDYYSYRFTSASINEQLPVLNPEWNQGGWSNGKVSTWTRCPPDSTTLYDFSSVISEKELIEFECSEQFWDKLNNSNCFYSYAKSDDLNKRYFFLFDSESKILTIVRLFGL